MQVADAELGALDVDRQIHLAAPRKVLDIAVPAVLWAARNGPGTFLSDLFLDIIGAASGVHAGRQRREGNVAVHVGASRDQLSLTLVPCLEDLLRWCAAKNAPVWSAMWIKF